MPTEPKLDLFRPETPRIPGVMPGQAMSDRESANTGRFGDLLSKTGKLLPVLWVVLTIGAMLATGMGLLWLSRRAPAPAPAVTGVTDLPSSRGEVGKPTEAGPIAPGEIGTTKEFARTWSAKRFVYRNAVTSEAIPAIAVRLPSGEMWGLGLREPYGTCELDYVVDLQKLKRDYHFAASHPMVVDTCSGTVFDLAVYGNGPNGLVRGEIVAGSGVRPPLAIKIETRGNQVFATRME
jgi:hypothetical protein